MKKLILTFLGLFALTLSTAQNVNNLDPIFKSKLVNTVCVDTNDNGDPDDDADTNNDGEIQVSEAEAVINLYVNENGLTSLQGIESFTNIEKLVCRVNQLTELDVTNNLNLIELVCNNNLITSLDVSQNENLELLTFGDNPITAIDVTQNPNLRILSVVDAELTSINVTQNPNLELLWVSMNSDIDAIDVTQNPSLTKLRFDRTDVSSIDVTQNPALEWLTSTFSNIASLDVTQNPNLKTLECDFNNLMSLDVSQNLELQSLKCGSNSLTTLDVSQNVNLSQLRCEGNLLESLFIKNGKISSTSSQLSFSQNPNLTYLCADEGELEFARNQADAYGYTDLSINTYCSFVPGGTYYTIQGNTKLDLENDSCDINDSAYPNLNFNIHDGSVSESFIGDISGNYTIPVPTGSYTITPQLEDVTYFEITPASIAVNFPADASPLMQDFCIVPDGIHNDLEIVIIPLEEARPGFSDIDYKIIYENKGNTVLSGSVDLTFNDDLIDLNSSDPVANSQSVGQLSWDYLNLLPFESREIGFKISANPPTDPTNPVNGGDVLAFTATINPIAGDETEDDNVFTLNQTVVNSFDPNDITCLEGASIAPEKVGDYVHYLIRFENTGSASAVNIVVKNVIDTNKFDVSSMIPGNGSHPFVTRVSDTNVVEFIFENINLPFDDANNDGYLTYKVKTVPTLVEGDVFENLAEIYFDFNAPIITNTAQTTVETLLSVENYSSDADIKMFPNPVDDVLHIESQNTLEHIAVYDLNGRLLQQIIMSDNILRQELSLKSLNKGLYFVVVRSSIGQHTEKIIKR